MALAQVVEWPADHTYQDFEVSGCLWVASYAIATMVKPLLTRLLACVRRACLSLLLHVFNNDDIQEQILYCGRHSQVRLTHPCRPPWPPWTYADGLPRRLWTFGVLQLQISLASFNIRGPSCLWRSLSFALYCTAHQQFTLSVWAGLEHAGLAHAQVLCQAEGTGLAVNWDSGKRALAP